MVTTKARLAFWLLGILVLSRLGLETGAEDAIDYQKIADDATWDWHEEMTNPLACIAKCGDKYDIRLVSSKDNRDSLSITVLSGKREIHTWQGHLYSVLGIVGDRLYYAEFHPSASGGRIVAVDLKTGKEMWSSHLEGLGGVSHSVYRTRLNLYCDRHVVTIYGDESYGRYIEFKRVDTGRTVGHKKFPAASSNEPQPQSPEPPKTEQKK